jgi:hypothetical protein
VFAHKLVKLISNGGYVVLPQELITQYCRATDARVPTVEGASSADALADLLRKCAAGAESAPFTLLDSSVDPYPPLALGIGRSYWEQMWAVRVADLLVVESPLYADARWYIDRVPDPAGAQRVYQLVDDDRGWAEFDSPEDFLRWMVAAVAAAQGSMSDDELNELESELAPPWMDVPVWEDRHWEPIESLLTLPIADAWLAYREGKWPPLQRPEPEALDAAEDRGPRWQRTVASWIAMTLLASGQTRLPEGVAEDELDPRVKELVGHLRDLSAAAKGDHIPALIQGLASEGGELGEGAREWITAFERARHRATGPENLARALHGRLEELVVALNANGEIEVEPPAVEELVEELVAATLGASSPKELEQRLIDVFMESDHVEEVYSDDLSLARHIRGALGG